MAFNEHVEDISVSNYNLDTTTEESSRPEAAAAFSFETDSSESDTAERPEPRPFPSVNFYNVKIAAELKVPENLEFTIDEHSKLQFEPDSIGYNQFSKYNGFDVTEIFEDGKVIFDNGMPLIPPSTNRNSASLSGPSDLPKTFQAGKNCKIQVHGVRKVNRNQFVKLGDERFDSEALKADKDLQRAEIPWKTFILQNVPGGKIDLADPDSFATIGDYIDIDHHTQTAENQKTKSIVLVGMRANWKNGIELQASSAYFEKQVTESLPPLPLAQILEFPLYKWEVLNNEIF